jgi:hypothetical protein
MKFLYLIFLTACLFFFIASDIEADAKPEIFVPLAGVDDDSLAVLEGLSKLRAARGPF